MKRPIFIIIGTIFIFILLMVWVYVLFFSTPTADGPRFADFNIFGPRATTTEVADVPPEVTEPAIDVVGNEPLRQLTSRPTAGFVEVNDESSSTTYIYYIEAGTGHVYSINMSTGNEERRSATTFSATRHGVITPDGKHVFVQSGLGSAAKYIVGTMATTSKSITPIELPEKIISFTATKENTFLYASQQASTVIVKDYDQASKQTRTLFTIPFREVAFDWGTSANDTHHAYPKATSQLVGFLYEARQDGSLVRLPVSGPGLTVATSDNKVLYSVQSDGVYHSYILDALSGSIFEQGTPILPEKCAESSAMRHHLYCGRALTSYGEDMPDLWYQGEVILNDDIWFVDLSTGESRLLIDVRNESGRQIDIVQPQLNDLENALYFINKTDRTLWVYEVPEPPKAPNTDMLEEGEVSEEVTI
jgi:hypothetical protein